MTTRRTIIGQCICYLPRPWSLCTRIYRYGWENEAPPACKYRKRINKRPKLDYIAHKINMSIRVTCSYLHSWFWPTDLNIERDDLLIKDYLPTKFEHSKEMRSSVISLTRWSRLTRPLTLTSDLNINRDHLLVKDYLPTKFGPSKATRSWVISCKRFFEDLWPWPLTYRP